MDVIDFSLQILHFKKTVLGRIMECQNTTFSLMSVFHKSRTFVVVEIFSKTNMSQIVHTKYTQNQREGFSKILRNVGNFCCFDTQKTMQ